MSTRSRRKREQKPSKRWREFIEMPRHTEDVAMDAVPIMWEACFGIPSYAGGGGGVWKRTDSRRHEL